MRTLDDARRQLSAATASTSVLARDFEMLVSRLDQGGRDGYPSSTLGGGGAPKGSVSDPTGRTALEADPSRRDSQLLLEAVDKLFLVALDLEALRRRWLTPAVRPNDGGEPGCAVLARVGEWAEIYRTTDLEGILDRKVPLGRWAYDFARREGRLPVLEEIRHHVGGGRVRSSKKKKKRFLTAA